MTKDAVTTCQDVLHLGHGHDGQQSFACMRVAGHSGPHKDSFERDGKSVIIVWRDANESIIPIANSQHLLLVRQIIGQGIK